MKHIKVISDESDDAIVVEPRLGVFIDRVAKDAQNLANEKQQLSMTVSRSNSTPKAFRRNEMSDAGIYSGLYDQYREHTQLADDVILSARAGRLSNGLESCARLSELFIAASSTARRTPAVRTFALALKESGLGDDRTWSNLGRALASGTLAEADIRLLEKVSRTFQAERSEAMGKMRGKQNASPAPRPGETFIEMLIRTHKAGTKPSNPVFKQPSDVAAYIEWNDEATRTGHAELRQARQQSFEKAKITGTG